MISCFANGLDCSISHYGFIVIVVVVVMVLKVNLALISNPYMAKAGVCHLGRYLNKLHLVNNKFYIYLVQLLHSRRNSWHYLRLSDYQNMAADQFILRRYIAKLK